MTAKTKVAKLTDEEVALLVAAGKRVWNEIASDCFETWEQEMSRSDVAELAFDAGRVCRFGVSQELYHKFCCASKDDCERVEYGAFPYARYGR